MARKKRTQILLAGRDQLRWRRRSNRPGNSQAKTIRFANLENEPHREFPQQDLARGSADGILSQATIRMGIEAATAETVPGAS